MQLTCSAVSEMIDLLLFLVMRYKILNIFRKKLVEHLVQVVRKLLPDPLICRGINCFLYSCVQYRRKHSVPSENTVRMYNSMQVCLI